MERPTAGEDPGRVAETTLPGLTRRSSFVGASLTMIDRHYGHLARDGRDHAINLLNAFSDSEAVNVHAVDAAWTSEASTAVHLDNGKTT